MKAKSSPTIATAPSPEQSAWAVFRDYLSLTKPEITFLVTISALGGFLLGSGPSLDGITLLALLVGVALSSSGGAALNLYVEREKDLLMKRTSNRPLPAGRISPSIALFIGCTCSIIGLLLLLLFTNVLTSILAGSTIALYVFLYTPLKQHTKYNTLVGTIPGALPALGGWTAATGSLGIGGWILFGILVVWQLPHFFALAWMYRKDYSRADFKMLPVVEPQGRSTATQMLSASVCLLVLSILPTILGLTGMLYLIGVTLVSIWLLYTSVIFYRTLSNYSARRVLKASILHIPVLVILIFLDRLV